MTGRAAPTAAELAAATPATRDRYVDLLRGASILAVVCGHWLMAVIWWRDSGAGGTNALALVRNVWILTWLLQVMPIFFFVGGFSNATAWESVRRRGGGYADYISGRVRRLMTPTVVFLVAWTVLANVLVHALGARFEQASNLIAQPMWFIAIYLIVVGLAPPMLALHRRYRFVAPLALASWVVVVDALRLGLHVPLIGWGNYGALWLLVQQLGFFYADGTLERLQRRAFAGAALVGLGALVALTATGLYPFSMVGVPGDKMSNMTPPSAAMLAHTLWLVAFVMILRDPARRWLARRRVWTGVVAVNGVIMTAFLWHLTALMIGVGIFFPLGFPQPDAGTLSWWLLRPVWVGILAAILAGLIKLLARFEHPKRATGTSPSAPASAIGLAVLVGGIIAFALGGFTGGPQPAGLPVLPLLQLGAVFGGVALLGAWRRSH